jgi:hypothetical protein
MRTSIINKSMKEFELKKEYISFLDNQNYTHSVTLKPNNVDYSKSTESLHRAFRKVHMLVQRKLWGSSYNRPHKIHLHTPAFAIIEGCAQSGHLHGSFKIPEDRFKDFEFLLDPFNQNNIWEKLIKSGSCWVDRIYDSQKWHSYCLKHVRHQSDVDKMVFLPSSRN